MNNITFSPRSIIKRKIVFPYAENCCKPFDYQTIAKEQQRTCVSDKRLKKCLCFRVFVTNFVRYIKKLQIMVLDFYQVSRFFKQWNIAEFNAGRKYHVKLIVELTLGREPDFVIYNHGKEIYSGQNLEKAVDYYNGGVYSCQIVTPYNGATEINIRAITGSMCNLYLREEYLLFQTAFRFRSYADTGIERYRVDLVNSLPLRFFQT